LSAKKLETSTANPRSSLYPDHGLYLSGQPATNASDCVFPPLSRPHSSIKFFVDKISGFAQSLTNSADKLKEEKTQ
jgi:hypothetical protein